jgi:hypothetical protein
MKLYQDVRWIHVLQGRDHLARYCERGMEPSGSMKGRGLDDI